MKANNKKGVRTCNVNLCEVKPLELQGSKRGSLENFLGSETSVAPCVTQDDLKGTAQGKGIPSWEKVASDCLGG
jgi:hypothetical protein